MKKSIPVIAAALMLISLSSFSKTPQQRMTELKELLPAGKTMKAVWTTADKIMCMSSEDGQIRTLVSGGVSCPNLTYNGSRVIYIKNESVVRCITWDGSKDSKVIDDGEMVRYWRDRETNTDWVLLTNGNRVNIDSPSQTQVYWNNATAINIMDYTPATLSRDGTHVGGHFPHPWFGVGVVPGGPLFIENKLETCYSTMAPDNSYDIMVQDGPHTTLYVRSKDGKPVAEYPISSSILGWAKANSGLNGQDEQEKFEDARWSNSRNFIITQMWATKGNPWIVRLSDTKFMYLEEVAYNSNGQTRGPDMVILPEDAASGVSNPGEPCIKATRSSPVAQNACLISGRKIGRESRSSDPVSAIKIVKSHR